MRSMYLAAKEVSNSSHPGSVRGCLVGEVSLLGSITSRKRTVVEEAGDGPVEACTACS